MADSTTEIHGANGYLVDQFLQDVVNQRTDKWGGSIENRSRFGVEVAKAITKAIGADKTGIRLSPFSTFQGMKMEHPVPQFSHFLRELKDLKLAYIHMVESRVAGNADVEGVESLDPLIKIWSGTSPMLLAGGFNPENAKKTVDETYKNEDIVVVFGRFFISNPDLVFKMQRGIAFDKYNRDTFYNPGRREGYIDYAYSKEWSAEHAKI